MATLVFSPLPCTGYTTLCTGYTLLSLLVIHNSTTPATHRYTLNSTGHYYSICLHSKDSSLCQLNFTILVDYNSTGLYYCKRLDNTSVQSP